ncbi:MAG: DUF3313 domain-containing protein [Planctomycetota bacterium]|jgi:hypothetical protein
MARIPGILMLALLVNTLQGGCAEAPKLTNTGFLSTYDNLEKIGENRMEYLTGEFVWKYDKVIIDRVLVLVHSEEPVMTAEERDEVISYFQSTLERVFAAEGYHLVSEPAPDAVRLRVAITDIQKSSVWANLHPGSKLMGAGTGGASMEGEIIDSLSGRQLAAVIQASKGSQFDLEYFDGLEDVKDAIDGWAKQARKTFEKIRAKYGSAERSG